MTLHRALIRANATGLAAGWRHAWEHGRVVWDASDRAAAFAAGGVILRREGHGHAFAEWRRGLS